MSEVFTPGNIAVITGAASGIGRATAKKLAGFGMQIVLIDTNKTKLPQAEEEVRQAGGNGAPAPQSFVCDVGNDATYKDMAETILENIGAPAFLMNNAAFAVHGGAGDTLAPVQGWRDLFDTNFFGVLNGVANFAPAMLEADKPGMIVNTGSKQGLTHPPGNPAYNVGKAALNAYTMNLARDLRQKGDRVAAHLLVPGWTTTGDNEHKPGAWLPEQVADYLVERASNGDFYIICPDEETTPEMDKKRVLWQALDLIENRPALSRWHPDYEAEFAEFMGKDVL